ncbi:MAG TPA: aminotransferase class V-fold PLP-dependent enzyme [Bacteroidota bacterium]
MIDTSSRRRFLKQFVGSAAAFSVAPYIDLRETSRSLALSLVEGLPTETPIDEAYWQMVKGQFTIKPGYTMMNAANLCPAPHMVQEHVIELTRDLDSDVSHQNRAKFSGMLEEARKKLAAYVGATEDEVAIVRNTSEANSFIVSGLSLKPGDEAVVLDQNHPTNNVAWDVQTARFSFTVKRVSLKSPPESAEEILKAFREVITSKTKVLTFSDVSNTTGTRLPVKQLCQLARERGIYTHVDGAQSFGALRVNVRDLGCDSYAASSHKWLMGPKEAGLLYVRQDRIAQVWPSIVGVGWGDKVEPAVKGARKFETLGQRDDATIGAMSTALDFHNLIGSATIEARVLQLAARLKEGLRKISGAQLVTSRDPSISAGVIVVKFEGADNRKIYDTLYSEHHIAVASIGGGVRFSPHIYNTLEDVDRTLEAMEKARKTL